MARHVALLMTMTWCLVTLSQVAGHGRLIEPPSRASMWRYGFSTPPNYNDHELYCGGYARQWSKNGGRCGVCGDAWDMPTPRPHEQGGKYGQGVITRRYAPGSNITVRVELTANHRGYFEFRLCPRESPHGAEITQDCLDQNLLQRADGRGARFYPGDLGNKVMEIRYSLPSELECYQCIFQWRYIAGNNWGDCGNGTGAVGCGPQEEFRACSDVAIGKGLPPTVFTTKAPRTSTERGAVSSTPAPTTEEEIEEAVWWIVLVVVCVTLLVVATTLALLYWYYYHASDNVKRILQSRTYKDQAPAPVTVLSPKQETPLPPHPPPVPPRRVKRLSSGDGNLV